MKADISKVTRKGQVTIPVRLRRAFGLEEGSHIHFLDDGKRIIIEPVVEDVEAAFGEAAAVVEDTLHFNRHTGVTLEPRGIVCDFNPSDGELTLHMSVQCPHMSKNLFAKHLGLDENKVRVICKDVGGSFGIKIHTYSDEMTAGAIAVKLARPVKFVADRLESFVSDIHARDHLVKARAAFSADGELLAIDMDDLTGIGPYSVYPRTSGIELNQVVNLTGGPYSHTSYRVDGRVVFSAFNTPFGAGYDVNGRSYFVNVQARFQ